MILEYRTLLKLRRAVIKTAVKIQHVTFFKVSCWLLILKIFLNTQLPEIYLKMILEYRSILEARSKKKESPLNPGSPQKVDPFLGAKFSSNFATRSAREEVLVRKSVRSEHERSAEKLKVAKRIKLIIYFSY